MSAEKSQVACYGWSKADSGSFRVHYGKPEPDPRTQDFRHRRYWIWKENGVKFGSSTWEPGFPPLREQ